MHIPTLFLDSIIKQAEEEIVHFEAKGQSSSRGKGRYHPYERTEKRSDKRSDSKNDRPLGRTLGRGSLPVIHRNQPRASSPINDNYCIDKLQRGLLAGSQTSTRQTLNTYQGLNVKLSCCPSCSFCARAFPKERIKSRISRLLLQKSQIKI